MNLGLKVTVILVNVKYVLNVKIHTVLLGGGNKIKVFKGEHGKPRA